MKQYRTTQTLAIGEGTVLRLDESQASVRANRLEPVGDGLYRAKELLQFKRGEVLGIEGEIPKVHESCLEQVEPAVEDAELKKPSPTSDRRGSASRKHGSHDL